MPVKKHYIPYISLISGIAIIIITVGLIIFFQWENIQQTISKVTCQERVNVLFYCQ